MFAIPYTVSMGTRVPTQYLLKSRAEAEVAYEYDMSKPTVATTMTANAPHVW